eukprot:GEMP01048608.1.p1 GENE.GEMP01048608.1~~GEMP01048608.1.p1  ORF type:complete len:305 (+),score=67.72 GEMP01048608.1:65-979(+)
MRVITLIVFFARSASGGCFAQNTHSPSVDEDWTWLMLLMLKEEMQGQVDKSVAEVKRATNLDDIRPSSYRLNMKAIHDEFQKKLSEPIEALRELRELRHTVLQYEGDAYEPYVAPSDDHYIFDVLLTAVWEKIREVEKKLSPKVKKLVKPYMLPKKMKKEMEEESDLDAVKFNIVNFRTLFLNKDVRNPILRELRQPTTGVAKLYVRLENLHWLANAIQKELQELKKNQDPLGNRRRLRGRGEGCPCECVAPNQLPGWPTAAIFASLASFCVAALFVIWAICYVARQQPNVETKADEGMNDARF